VFCAVIGFRYVAVAVPVVPSKKVQPKVTTMLVGLLIAVLARSARSFPFT
jgi:hypothetical protein